MGFLKKMLNSFEEKAGVLLDSASEKIGTQIDALDNKVQQRVDATTTEASVMGMKSNADDTLATLGAVSVEQVPVEQPVYNVPVDTDDFSDLL